MGRNYAKLTLGYSGDGNMQVLICINPCVINCNNQGRIYGQTRNMSKHVHSSM